MTGTYWPHVLAIAVGAGLTALVACAVALSTRPQVTAFGQVPAWAWLGGLLGATYVFAVTLLGPRLGAVALVALVLAGQLGAALLLDHFGALGFPKAAVTLPRVLGAVLLVAGALLVVRR